MENIIKTTFEKSFQKILKEVDKVEFRHINESVFRYIFIRSLPLGIGIEDEWKRIDLLLHDTSGQYAIEFKQYDTRPLNRFDGKNATYKGGASPKNFDEFLYSARKLVELKNYDSQLKMDCNIEETYFILLAGDRGYAGRKFSEDYGGRHIDELRKIGIEANEIISKSEQINTGLTIFGWVLKIWK